MSLRKKLLDTFGAQVSSDHERYPAEVKCLGLLYLYVGRYPRNNASRNRTVQECVNPSQSDRHYPELSCSETYGVVRKRQEEKKWNHLVGFAFSGGGTRAAAATLGQLRALRELGWLSRADYISAISSGSWTVVPYVYLPKGEGTDQECCANPDCITDEEFIGEYREPGQLTYENLYGKPNGKMAEAIHTSLVTAKFIKNAISFRGDEVYAKTVGELFLKDFGLYDSASESFFTWNEDTREAILTRQEQGSEELKRDDVEFITVTRERPYPIIGGTLISDDADPGKRDMHLFEMTPIYSGVPVHADISISKEFHETRVSSFL
uniref:Patatin-like phospholipase n=1 Tax=Candidatus Kentrum sp. FM TaxID=2126340 RepID=A0A450VWD8_9GAMM|nr:MAG: Patatin-like phospholipase [Candidatus Kentron sp. FM]VFJ52145.1 MAG: Patatin-like phospholipase [Candidatus Kentron sp. FM]VFK09131.1 MAG: Patatin-like phospholipase [Candidatus Kentron sp. FM]